MVVRLLGHGRFPSSVHFLGRTGQTFIRIFILEGLASIVVSFFAFWFTPDYPETSVVELLVIVPLLNSQVPRSSLPPNATKSSAVSASIMATSPTTSTSNTSAKR